MKNRQTRFISTIVILLMACMTFDADAKELPAELPRPDNQKKPDLTKPIKVYILSGQSNMVGLLNKKGKTDEK